jgi:YHS domain-containing protein
VAGYADAAVPVSFWRSLFLAGHGFWSVLENVILGPFLAIISFVCSIGNVPLAAALWSGGIAFGGTVAFVFADLITLPLLLIYRRYYGTRLTIRLLAVFWATMSAAGPATEYLFRWARIAPAARTSQRAMPAQGVWGWNCTTILDIIALAAFAGLYWLYRNRERLGGGAGYAKDPVCGMQIQVAHAPATARSGGTAYHFCSDHCQQRFSAAPARYTGPEQASTQHGMVTVEASPGAEAVDPVCGMTIDLATATAHASHDGQEYYFCSPACRDHFSAGPASFASEHSHH